MKVRFSIAGALLFVLVLAPTALRASARSMRVPPCRVAKTQRHINGAGTSNAVHLVQLVAPGPGHHHTPAPRLHRIRGKKINVQGSPLPLLQSFAATRYLVPDTLFGRQNMDGPNPSRGPPSPISL
jgi:hypothetical protein